MRIWLILCLILVVLSSKAQHSFFSQHEYAVPETSSAIIAIDSYTSATLIYKNQKFAGLDHLNSTLLFAKYPISNHKNNRLVLGVTFSENKIVGAGKLTKQLFSSTLAYSFFYAKNEGISFAMDFGLVTKKVDLNDVQTGAMWTIENGFDPGMSSGETLESERLVYPRLNASIYWFANDKNEDIRSYVGVSVFQMNKSKDSFYDTEKRINNSQITAIAGLRIYDKSQFAISPKILLTSTTSRIYTKIGMDFNYSLSRFKNNVSRKENSFNVEVNYQVNKGPQFGIQYLQPKYVAGIAYHMDVGNSVENNLFNNAIEVLFVVRSPVKTTYQKRRSSRKRSKRKKNKRSKENTSPPTKSKVTNNEVVEGDSLFIQPDFIPSLNDDDTKFPMVVKDELNDIETDEWSSSLLLGEKNNLNFEYNSTQINDFTFNKLKELADLLTVYPNSRVVLIGHTDDVGSPRSNQKFSVKRATTAAQVLKQLGISDKRIITQGRGESEPVDTNLTERGRHNNRRIEIYLIND